MMRKLLFISASVLLGSMAVFSQTGTANCPKNQRQVETKFEVRAGFNVGIAGASATAERRSTECQDKKSNPTPGIASGSNRQGATGKGGGGGGGRGW